MGLLIFFGFVILWLILGFIGVVIGTIWLDGDDLTIGEIKDSFKYIIIGPPILLITLGLLLFEVTKKHDKKVIFKGRKKG